MLDAANTTKEIRDRAPEIAVFGIGAVEQHSSHLPLGTDWLGVSDLARRVARELDAFLVPALPFSMSQCHGPMAGTVWLKPETLAEVLRDVVLSLRAQGIRRILVLDGHGGNTVLGDEIRRLNLDHPDLTVLQGRPPAPPDADAPLWEAPIDIHSGERETSSQAYINPLRVHEESVDFVPEVGQEFLDYVFMDQISPSGVWGQPSLGTAEKGERALARRVRRIAEWAEEGFARVEALRQRGEALNAAGLPEHDG